MVRTDVSVANGPDVKDGPVFGSIYKRIRNAKKRLRAIDDNMAKKEAGKELNEDQIASLTQRPTVVAVIEELERYSKILEDSLKEELATATTKAREEGAAEALASVPKNKKTDEEWEKEMKKAVSAARKEAKEQARANFKTKIDAATKKAAQESIKSTTESLIELLYFSQAFDIYSHFSDYQNFAYALQQSGVTMPSDAMELAVAFRVLTTRPYNTVNHVDALTACKEAARRLLTDQETSLTPPMPSVTGKKLFEMVEMLQNLEYCKTGSFVPVAAVEPSVVSQPAKAEDISNNTTTTNNSTTPPAPVANGKNLMEHFFGNKVKQPVANGGSPAFVGDSELGIEGIPLESENSKSSSSIVAAEVPGPTEDNTINKQKQRGQRRNYNNNRRGRGGNKERNQRSGGEENGSAEPRQEHQDNNIEQQQQNGAHGSGQRHGRGHGNRNRQNNQQQQQIN